VLNVTKTSLPSIFLIVVFLEAVLGPDRSSVVSVDGRLVCRLSSVWTECILAKRCPRAKVTIDSL